MNAPLCDECGKICTRTPVGHYVILCREDKVLCMGCNRIRLCYQELLCKHENVIHYLNKNQKGLINRL
jgi:hypothetical protein